MIQHAAHSVARDRAVLMDELRRLLPGVMELRTACPFSLNALDSHLPEGGLACGALHEVVPKAEGSAAAAFGFIAAILARFAYSPHSQGRKVFLILPAYAHRRYGRLYGHGLHALGLDPACLILVETTQRKDTLWAIEEAVRSRAPAAVAGMIDRLDLKISQRLQFFAIEAGLPLFLLRPATPTLPSCGGGSAAATRWRVGTAEAARDRFGLFARARWHLRLERVRNGRPGEWVVEYDHVAHRFSLAAALADSARAGGASEKVGRKSHRA